MAKQNNTNKIFLAAGIGLTTWMLTRKKADTTTAENKPAPNTVPGKNGGNAPQTNGGAATVTGVYIGATSTQMFFNPVYYIGKSIYTGKPRTNVRTGPGLNKSIVKTIENAGTLVGTIKGGFYDTAGFLWYQVEQVIWSSPVITVYIRHDVASFSPTVDTNSNAVSPQQTNETYTTTPQDTAGGSSQAGSGKLLQWGLLGGGVYWLWKQAGKKTK
ncbi:MAG: hypothetical protein ACXWW0_00070 [Bacteroidia bacterium]